LGAESFDTRFRSQSPPPRLGSCWRMSRFHRTLAPTRGEFSRRKNMKVGFIGLGMMGRGMAANIQKAGYQMVVHDLSKQAAQAYVEKGATWADTPRALAEACDLVFTSLPTPADVEDVALGENGLAAGFRTGAAWFDLSTNAVDVVRRLNRKLAEQGVDFLDAPVSGGPAGAASGKLAIWVGGDEAVYQRHKSVLEAMADQARYIGPI